MLSNLILIFKAAIMGVIEGITEFLPISSTGHLILTGKIIGFTTPKSYVDMFEVVIQLGAILAIIVLYWEKIVKSLKHLMPGDWGFNLWKNVVIAAIPAFIFGFTLKHTIDKLLMDNVWAVASAMVVGGFLLLFMENKFRKKAFIKDTDQMNWKQSLVIGFFQCLALWPGMSRSASTIMGAWVGGLTNFAAAEFSFFLAIPIMIGATGLSMIKMPWSTVTSVQYMALAVGFIVSFVVALFVVEGFMNFLKRKKMRIFSLYRIAAGIIVLILAFAKVL